MLEGVGKYYRFDVVGQIGHVGQFGHMGAGRVMVAVSANDVPI